ncbi:MAG: cupin domain-containing protein [Opitutus sp.]
MNEDAARLIARLGLEPLPREGGFFRRTWTSETQLSNGRSAGSAITFLLTETDFSALHRMPTDELWFFHAGDPVEHVRLNAARSTPIVTVLGANPAIDQTPQLIVTGGVWQGARLGQVSTRTNRVPPQGWALMSCTMAPAWDEAEFELGDRAALLREFSEAAQWIHGLTR